MECFEFDPQVFAERLRDLRTEKGVGQNKLAADLSLSNAGISYWENGKQEQTASATGKLSAYFDVSTDYLLDLID